MDADSLPLILIVDDDLEIRSLLGDYLRARGYGVKMAADGVGMRRILEHERVSLIVLDLMLPGEDGLALCRSVRAQSQVPIIMLSARVDVVDRIIGIEMGSDDYLPKPFDPRELLARIKSVLRRVDGKRPVLPEGQVSRYQFAGWTLDSGTRNLIDVDGNVVPLSGVEYRLLTALLSRPQRVLSRNQLMQLTSGRETEPFDRGIDVRVSRLRQLLCEDAREPAIIRTVYGEGYMLGVDVSTG
jgi:two-component system OmpR family response regulator